MKVEHKGNTVVIKDTAESVKEFLDKVVHEYKTFESHNIVLDLTHNPSVKNTDIKLFQTLSKQHKKRKKSFVIVASGIDFNSIPETINAVPTLLEAHDVIEIEEIERDLGF